MTVQRYILNGHAFELISSEGNYLQTDIKCPTIKFAYVYGKKELSKKTQFIVRGFCIVLAYSTLLA